MFKRVSVHVVGSALKVSVQVTLCTRGGYEICECEQKIGKEIDSVCLFSR